MDLIAISNQVTTFLVVCVMPVGVLLNCFSFYVFTRPALNLTNMGFLNRVQLGIDVLLLLSNIFLFRTKVLFNVDIYISHEVICKGLTLYRRYILHISSFTNLFITWDRFCIVHYANRFGFMKKKKNLMLCLMGIYLLLLAANSLNALMFIKETVTLNNSTRSQSENSTLVNFTRVELSTSKSCEQISLEIDVTADIMTLLLRTYIPLTLMVIFNSIIIRDLYKSKYKANLKPSKKETQFTLSVILSNIVFALFYVPLLVSYVLKFTYNFSGANDPSYKTVLDFIYNIALIYAYLYQTLESLMMLFVNNLFRSEVLKILRLKKSNCVRENTSRTNTIKTLRGSII